MTLNPEQIKQLVGGISAAAALPEPELVKQLVGGVSCVQVTAAIQAAEAHQHLQVRIGVDNANRLLELSRSTFLSLSTLVDAWDSALKLEAHDEAKAWELLTEAIETNVHPEDLKRDR